MFYSTHIIYSNIKLIFIFQSIVEECGLREGWYPTPAPPFSRPRRPSGPTGGCAWTWIQATVLGLYVTHERRQLGVDNLCKILTEKFADVSLRYRVFIKYCVFFQEFLKVCHLSLASIRLLLVVVQKMISQWKRLYTLIALRALKVTVL